MTKQRISECVEFLIRLRDSINKYGINGKPMDLEEDSLMCDAINYLDYEARGYGEQE